jgi:AraC family transcriptional regulator of adaptative response/methylated-DNA-[protein]-cysteine methyltransferase
MIKTIKINTPIGEMSAAATHDGVCYLIFVEEGIQDTGLEKLAGIMKTTIRGGTNKHLRVLRKQLKEYFKGKRKEFLLPLITPGTDFQQAVWNNIMDIPYGMTKSYREQAEELKDRKSARAVAQANSSNRIAIIIPCHRVIGSDGSLVGYGGGLQRKRWLLNHERIYSGKAVELDLF